MRERGYYSTRTGKNKTVSRVNLSQCKRLFLVIYNDFWRRDYFQEAFGYNCVDVGEVPGTLGDDIAGRIYVAIRKSYLWPIQENIESYSDEDLFDIVEFLFDYISEPLDGYYHSFNDCGMHYTSFNRGNGQEQFRKELNPGLAMYDGGYILTERGEILHLPQIGMSTLIAASLPQRDPENIEARVEKAKDRFLRHHSSLEDRKHALRDLADVLEYLRPQIKAVVSKKDENDLFSIINTFGIRHHNPQQKTNYDTSVWYSWMFYFYLATIHACLRLIEKRKG
jgi:hypothetical protein